MPGNGRWWALAHSAILQNYMSIFSDTNASEYADFLASDLQSLITALGEQALTSQWLCTSVECYGQSADELHTLSDQQLLVDGRELLRIVENIYSIVDGYFKAFQIGEATPWLVVRAVDGIIYNYGSSQHIPPYFKPIRTESAPSSSKAESSKRFTITINESMPIISASLRRIQTEGESIANFVIFIADKEKNYYIQVAPESTFSPYSQKTDEYSLYAEAVGNAILDPKYALQPSQIEQTRSLGWKASSLTPNFYQTWRAESDNERNLIARIIIDTFIKIYRKEMDQVIEVKLTIPSTS
jgi:hypothetical protein